MRVSKQTNGAAYYDDKVFQYFQRVRSRRRRSAQRSGGGTIFGNSYVSRGVMARRKMR